VVRASRASQHLARLKRRASARPHAHAPLDRDAAAPFLALAAQLACDVGDLITACTVSSPRVLIDGSVITAGNITCVLSARAAAAPRPRQRHRRIRARALCLARRITGAGYISCNTPLCAMTFEMSGSLSLASGAYIRGGNLTVRARDVWLYGSSQIHADGMGFLAGMGTWTLIRARAAGWRARGSSEPRARPPTPTPSAFTRAGPSIGKNTTSLRSCKTYVSGAGGACRRAARTHARGDGVVACVANRRARPARART
jgi:hypothetical protein